MLVGIGILVMNLPALLRRQRLPALGLTAATTFTDSANVPAGTPLPDSAAVMVALGRVFDPEIGISIVDLGLVNSLRIDSAGTVKATIILTTPECPYVQHLGVQATKEVIAVRGVRRVRVRLDPTLPWDPSRLTPEARELYRKRFGGGLPRLPGDWHGFPPGKTVPVPNPRQNRGCTTPEPRQKFTTKTQRHEGGRGRSQRSDTRSQNAEVRSPGLGELGVLGGSISDSGTSSNDDSETGR